MIFGALFGDFWGYGEIVKIELSRESELNLEGWRVSEIVTFWCFFEDLSQNLPKGVPEPAFWDFGALKWPKAMSNGPSNPLKIE